MEKIALIEIGTASLRLMILKTKEGGYFDLVDEIEEQTKLGKDVETDGVLKPLRISECINILKMFRRVCDVNGVSKIIAIATSLVRDAKNQTSFLDEIYNSCGFYVNVLSVEEEMKAVYSGVVNTIDIPKGIIINISNRTTQIIQYNRRYILNQATLPFGSLTLADKFGSGDGSLSHDAMNNIKEFFASELNKIEFLKGLDPEVQFIGAGPIFTSLGKLARKTSKYPLDLENNYILSAEAFSAVFNFVKTLDADKTKKIKGISGDRADTIVAGFSMISAVYEQLKMESFSIAANGIREGFIYNYIVPETNEKPLSDMIGYSLENIRAFYDRELSNTAQVYNLAILLFKQLKVIHKLHRYYVKPLRIAASMYDCGKRIKFEENEKNSFEIILNSNINGVSQREILLAAFASRVQDLDNFSLSEWVRYKDIVTEEDMDAVRKLGVLIKLAAALDRTRAGVVKDISCDILGDSVIMKTTCEGDASFEIMEAMKVGNDFKRVFKKYLEVI